MAVPRGLSDVNQHNGLTCPTLNAPRVGNKGKFSQRSNPNLQGLRFASQSGPANENPGALAGATGVKDLEKASELSDDDIAAIAARHPIIALHWGIEL
jgi:hypothetical protein